MNEAGWQVWVQDKDRFRLFAVAQPDFAQAEKIAAEQVGATKCYSYHALPESVIKFLGLKENELVEWVPGDRLSTIKPGGTTRGGKYDTQHS